MSFETQSIPEKNITQLNYQTIYNSLGTFKPFTLGVHDRSKGFLGLFGSPKNYLPDDFPSSSEIQALAEDSEELAEIGRKVNHDFITTTRKAMPSQSLSISLARRYEKSNGTWGLVFISNLTNTFNTQNVQMNVLGSFDPDLGYNPVADSTKYPLYQNQQNYNQVANIGYQNEKLQVNFKNFFSISQWDKYINQFGDFYFEGAWEPYQFNVKRFEKQFLYSGQIHALYQLSTNQKIGLTLFSNSVNFKEPGFYPVNYSINSNGEYYISDSWVPEDRIFYTIYSSKQNDFSYGANLFYENQILKKDQHRLTFKSGLFLFNQKRTFASRKTGIVPTLENPNIDVQELLAQGQDFTYDHSLIRPGGFFFFDDTQIHDAYLGKTVNIAPFLQATYQFSDAFQLYTGIRMESASTKIISNGIQKNPQTIHNNSIFDVLPSFIANYNLKTNHRLKFSYCQSIVKPNMRELSLFSFFNPITSTSWEGNPDAIRTKINSFDLRYEYFPGKLNMFSVTLFWKYIYRPLEQVLAQGATVYLNTYTLKNADYANNLGIELEVRQQLGIDSYLKNFHLYGNAMFQNSNVKDDRTGNTQRPLQGQSPYLVNTGILFKEPKTNINFDVFYNRYGRQIVIIGVPVEFNNLYILPRHRIDVQIGKTFKEKFMMKVAFQDILAQPFYKVQFQQNEQTGQLKDARLAMKTSVGRLITVSLQYRF